MVENSVREGRLILMVQLLRQALEKKNEAKGRY
jgi:hypothetical protein